MPAENMSVVEPVSDGTGELNTFLSLAFRPKNKDGVPAPKEVGRKHVSLSDQNGFFAVDPPRDDQSDEEEPPDVDADDDLFDDEDVLQSHAQRRTRRRQAKRLSGLGDRPLRLTLGGRIGKTRSSQPRAAEPRHHIAPVGLGSRTRRLLPSRQFLRRKAAPTAAAASASVPVLADDIWDAMLAIPGFSFSVSAWMGSGLGSRLGRLLADPSIVRRCGCSLKRRRLPNFLLIMLAFPIRAHHGRGVFERDCGYAPGNEHDPAFWQRFAAAFGLWLGLEHDPASGDEELGPPSGGVLLRDLTTFLSSSRARFLDLQRWPRQHDHDDQLQLFRQLAPRPDGRLKVLRARRRRTILGEEADDDDDDNEAIDDAHDVTMPDDGPVLPQRQANQPTQLQRRVSVATDAWALFLEKSREADFDLEMLAAMCI